MNLTVSIQDLMSGHTELEFKDGEVTLDWKDTTKEEKAALSVFVEKAKSNGFTIEAAIADDKREEVAEKLPSVFFAKSGKLFLKGENAKLAIIATGLVESEIKRGKMVMELQDDNSWKIMRAEQFVAEEAKDKTKKKTVHVSGKAGGG